MVEFGFTVFEILVGVAAVVAAFGYFARYSKNL